MEKQTESERVFKFDENRRLYAVDVERNIYTGTMDEALELSQTDMFQLKRSPETEKYFEGTDAGYVLFARGEVLDSYAKQDVTQNLFILDTQNITDMNKYDVLANLREYCDHIYGEDRDENDIIEAFGNFEENGSTTSDQILFDDEKGNNKIVHIDVEGATKFLFTIDKQFVIKSVDIIE
ncbi:MAG: hypothetical protein SOV71_05115 [Anaerovoracaceae bacterium]|nr:hypothetical protein [Bacillota bacterium]MDY2670918.1 hypothetical protein [Anaerovoracaceae bacterium]